MNTERAYRALQEVAYKENMTVENVIKEIDLAIAEALKTEDPRAQALWRSFPWNGKQPTAVEFVAYMSEML